MSESAQMTEEEFSEIVAKQVPHATRAFTLAAKELSDLKITSPALVTGALISFINLLVASGLDAGKSRQEILEALGSSMPMMTSVAETICDELETNNPPKSLD